MENEFKLKSGKIIKAGSSGDGIYISDIYITSTLLNQIYNYLKKNDNSLLNTCKLFDFLEARL